MVDYRGEINAYYFHALRSGGDNQRTILVGCSSVDYMFTDVLHLYIGAIGPYQ